MSIPLWGQLQKAQDDSETIEEAIARMILEHEEDPEAHLGEGESLEMHKTEDTVDHPRGSILPDKITFQDSIFDTTFESIAGFTKSAHFATSSWPGATADYYTGGNTPEYLRANLTGLLQTGTITKRLQFDTYFYIDGGTNPHTFNVGISNSAMTQFDIGFRVTNYALVGFARWSSSEHVTSTLATLTAGAFNFVRVYYDVDGGVIYFYLNGVQVGTLQPSAAVSANNQFTMHISTTDDEGGVLRIFRLNIAKGL